LQHVHSFADGHPVAGEALEIPGMLVIGSPSDEARECGYSNHRVPATTPGIRPKGRGCPREAAPSGSSRPLVLKDDRELPFYEGRRPSMSVMRATSSSNFLHSC